MAAGWQKLGEGILDENHGSTVAALQEPFLG